MSEAKNQNENLDGSESDRRIHPDSKMRDRRVIARFSDPHLRTYARLIKRLSLVWVSFALLYLVVLGAVYATKGVAQGARAAFCAVVIAALASCVHRVGRGAKSYLENESQARAAVLMERLFLLLFVFSTLTGVLGIAHLITLF